MELKNCWSTLREILIREFTFSEIKSIMGICGLEVYELHNITQKQKNWATKSQLMDGIDNLFSHKNDDDKNKIIENLITEIIDRKVDLLDELNSRIIRFGWLIKDNNIVPNELQVDIEISNLPEEINENLTKVLYRYKQNDIDGAFTAICSMVDKITEKIYIERNLGNHLNTSYHERVNVSFKSLENQFKATLAYSTLSPEDIIKLWNNYKGAISNSAFMLGNFRINFADVHGCKAAPPELIQTALNCAIFIIRAIQWDNNKSIYLELYNRIPQNIRDLLLQSIVKRIGRSEILNSNVDIKMEFKKTSFTKFDYQTIKRFEIIDENQNLTEKGINVLKAIAFQLVL